MWSACGIRYVRNRRSALLAVMVRLADCFDDAMHMHACGRMGTILVTTDWRCDELQHSRIASTTTTVILSLS